MKKIYQPLYLEIIVFSGCDVICTSGLGDGENETEGDQIFG